MIKTTNADTQETGKPAMIIEVKYVNFRISYSYYIPHGAWFFAWHKDML